jgi:hypothetical protein
MTDIGGWGYGDDQADDAAAPIINGGLLDPRTFPTPWPPAPKPRSPDQDVRDEVERDIGAAQAKLPPVGAPAGSDGADYGGDWMERSPPMLKRGLDTDTTRKCCRTS